MGVGEANEGAGASGFGFYRWGLGGHPPVPGDLARAVAALDNGSDGALGKLESLGDRIVVPGHGALCDMDYVARIRAYVEALLAAVSELVARGWPMTFSTGESVLRDIPFLHEDHESTDCGECHQGDGEGRKGLDRVEVGCLGPRPHSLQSSLLDPRIKT